MSAREAVITQVHATQLIDGTWQASVIYDDATEGTACADSMYAAIAHATRDRPRPIVKGVR